MSAANKSRAESSTLEGVVERVVFHNARNGWTVLRLKPPKGGLLQTVVGTIQVLHPGETVRFSGAWVNDTTHGLQFRAETCLPLAPATLVGIEKFLGSGMVPGIGKVMAARLVRRFGLQTLEIIESHPERLAEVEGVGAVRARAISGAMMEKKGIRDVMVFLESAGISPAYAHRVYRRFGREAIRVVSDNPYQLAYDVHGIGFRMADQIAAHLGVPKDSPHRAEAGLLFTLEECAREGHVYVPADDLLPRAGELLEMDEGLLSTSLERLRLMGRVVGIGEASDAPMYLPRLERAERTAAMHLQRLLAASSRPMKVSPEAAVSLARDTMGLDLAVQQQQAFHALHPARVLVLTGGPGTGKTTLLKGILEMLKRSRQTLALAAPTGRAAKRMSESTGQEAATLHRLLEFTPRIGAFARNEENPLPHDVVIVDEMSMVDIELFSALLAAIPDRARVILVGDPDQLPSVGPGTVLADLLSLAGRLSPALSVVRLTEIFRQAASSLIIRGAHDILRGTVPRVGEKGESADLFLVERDDPEDCLEVIRQLVKERIPRNFGLDPIADIQVLTPMHRGTLGSANLNTELQALLNPPTGNAADSRTFYRRGDKVMQIRNNYDLEVFNGDIGVVDDIDPDGESVRVDYGLRKVTYPVGELDQTTLAYACSIHKSQGSEYPAVVIPLHTQHYVMLARNLLYTAVTRGRRLVVIVGSQKALRIAVANNRQKHRCSGLSHRTIQQ